uniref:LSM domain-containing protein n=1 Tax=Octopus bimaculoides TaxID=37653 RepID=A0A0L8GMP0_OCTBM|eukprot:XP_014779688.1 PREDICTED: uncharacterized protein LOC106875896 [Octopus bimaculoides]
MQELTKEEEEEQQQSDRAFLRERFLRFLLALDGNHADLIMQENNIVSGKLLLADLNFENLMVRDLQTPIGTLPHALLRTNDILSFRLNMEET